MMTTVSEELRLAEHALAGVSDTPRLDAEILLAHALGVGRAGLLARLRDTEIPAAFHELVERRKRHEPIAYILGEWEFYSLTFEVAPPVLVPRPETEHLVEVALREGPAEDAHVLDVGLGTGCVAISLAVQRPAWRVDGIDIQTHNVSLAQRNALRHEVEPRTNFSEGDLTNPIAGPYDAIVSNPPYVAEGDWDGLDPVIRLHEDAIALTSGPDGLDAIRALAANGWDALHPGGLLAFEFGYGQRDAVASIMTAQGYARIGFEPDLAGIPRVAWGRRPQ